MRTTRVPSARDFIRGSSVVATLLGALGCGSGDARPGSFTGEAGASGASGQVDAVAPEPSTFDPPVQSSPDSGMAAPPPIHPLDHVTARRFTGMMVEVDYVTSAPPSGAALAEVSSRVVRLMQDGYLDKPEGLRIVEDQSLSPLGSQAVSTAETLVALVDETSTVPAEPWESTLHVVYVDGAYEKDTDEATVLGLSYAAQNIVVFRDNIREACESSATLLDAAAKEEACAMSEAAVLMHEIGHAFGLVANGVPIQSAHHDEPNGPHCTNPDCLMYYAAENSSLIARMVGRFGAGARGIPEFDEACLSDLGAAAGL